MNPADWHAAAIRSVEDADPEPLVRPRVTADRAELVPRMVADVRRVVAELLDAARALDPDPLVEPGVPLALDMLAADRFEGIGERGRKIAASLRRSAAERAERHPEEGAELFAFWLAEDGPPRFLARLVDALFNDRWADWRPRVPAVSLVVIRPALGERFDATRWAPSAAPPAVSGGVLRELVDAGVLESLSAQRFLRWAVAEACRRENAGEPHPERFAVLGGWQGLARVIGATSNQAADELRDIVEALYRYDLVLPGGGGARLLATFDHQRRGSGGSVLLLTIGDPLRPGFATRHNGRDERALVPILPLPPVEVVNPRSAAAAARLDVLAVAELRDRVGELATHGAVALDWEELADRAGLPSRALAPLLGRWQADPSARWVRVGEAWTLADRPETAAALAFLRVAGRMVTRGRAGGLKRARNNAG